MVRTVAHLSDIDEICEKCLLLATEDVITASTLYDYCVSPFMVYCEQFGPEDRKDALTEFQKFLPPKSRFPSAM